MNQPQAKIDIEQELSDQLTIHKSLGQEVMVTTVDKVRLCLIQHLDCLRAKHEWLMPLSLLLTFLATLLSAEFTNFVLKAPVWEAIFIIGFLVSVVWLGLAGLRAWKIRKLGGIDAIISQLKQASVTGTDGSPDTEGAV